MSRNGKPEPTPASGSRTFDVDELAPPDVVIVGGAPYELTRAGGLSLIEQARLARSWKRIAAVDERIQKGVEPTNKELVLYREDAELVAGLALKTAPREVIHALDDGAIVRLLAVFFTRAATAGALSRTIRALMPEPSAISEPTSPSSPTPTGSIR